MRNLPRHTLAPCQAESILATYSRGRVFTIPQDWSECPITLYLLFVKIKKKRLYQKQPEKGQSYVGIEPTPSEWKSDILAAIRIGQIT